MIITSIISSIARASKGKTIIPMEIKKWDHLGNNNGHLDIDDFHIVAEKAWNDISSFAQSSAEALSDISDSLSDAASEIGEFFIGLFS